MHSATSRSVAARPRRTIGVFDYRPPSQPAGLRQLARFVSDRAMSIPDGQSFRVSPLEAWESIPRLKPSKPVGNRFKTTLQPALSRFGFFLSRRFRIGGLMSRAGQMWVKDSWFTTGPQLGERFSRFTLRNNTGDSWWAKSPRFST